MKALPTTAESTPSERTQLRRRLLKHILDNQRQRESLRHDASGPPLPKPVSRTSASTQESG